MVETFGGRRLNWWGARDFIPTSGWFFKDSFGLTTLDLCCWHEKPVAPEKVANNIVITQLPAILASLSNAMLLVFFRDFSF